MTFILAALIISLGAIFLQDWKYRKIHVFLPVLVFAFCFASGETASYYRLMAVVYNSAFFLVVLTILILYMSARNGKFLNPFQNYFGLGDVMFYLAVTPVFLLRNYVLFFIFSMVFAIIMQTLLKRRIQESTVPLAGFAALLLLGIIVLDVFKSINKMTLL